MDARYLKATTTLPSDVKVCGKRLLPFCLRHRVLLESIDSPFINGSIKFRPYDVVIASRIIGSYSKSVLSQPLSFVEQLFVFNLKYNSKKLHFYIGVITGFIAESCSYPKLWNKKSKSKENIPWVLSCVANNVRNGCTLDEAWTMPEGEAVWMSISHAVYNGSDVNVISTDDDTMMSDFDKIIERHKQTKLKN